MEQQDRAATAQRIEQLELLVAQMRHDVCGALSPAMLMADMLLRLPDEKVRTAAQRIVNAIERTTELVRATRATVPPRSNPPTPPGG